MFGLEGTVALDGFNYLTEFRVSVWLLKKFSRNETEICGKFKF